MKTDAWLLGVVVLIVIGIGVVEADRELRESECEQSCGKCITTVVDNPPVCGVECAACEAQGGLWGRQSVFLEDETCFLPTKDAGKPCIDGQQCEGSCIGTEGNGSCSDTHPLPPGCYSLLYNGTADRLCID
ncbi:hypothetical protein HY493_01025 [Candidatus Woesearchaeota archaeon]|nr:hypothetical protein [Candidatus Woesearchaeota archaeon]